MTQLNTKDFFQKLPISNKRLNKKNNQVFKNYYNLIKNENDENNELEIDKNELEFLTTNKLNKKPHSSIIRPQVNKKRYTTSNLSFEKNYRRKSSSLIAKNLGIKFY